MMSSRKGTERQLLASFTSWMTALDDAQLAALEKNWVNVMSDAALDRIDSWVIAEKAIARLSRNITRLSRKRT